MVLPIKCDGYFYLKKSEHIFQNTWMDREAMVRENESIEIVGVVCVCFRDAL